MKPFTLDDFDCKCCGKNWTDVEIVKRMNRVQQDLQEPVTITSGYRCDEHNLAVGGKKNSQHRLGRAVDCKAKNMDRLYEVMARYFQALGDGRPHFVHGDLRPEYLRWVY